MRERGPVSLKALKRDNLNAPHTTHEDKPRRQAHLVLVDALDAAVGRDPLLPREEAEWRLCAVADRSGLARLTGDGPDLADLLHRLGVDLTPSGPQSVTLHAFPTFLHKIDAQRLLERAIAVADKERLAPHRVAGGRRRGCGV